MPRPWQGLNQRVSSTEQNPLESPDTTNTHHYNGRHGLLGPRKGVSQAARPAYARKLGRPFVFKGPWGTYVVAPTLDGGIYIYAGADRTQAAPWTTNAAGSFQDPDAGSPISASSSGSSASTTSTFYDSATYDARTGARFSIRTQKAGTPFTNATWTHNSTSTTFTWGPTVNSVLLPLGRMTVTGSGILTMSFGGSDQIGGVSMPLPEVGTINGGGVAVINAGGGSSIIESYGLGV